MFRRVPCIFEKEVKVQWYAGRQRIHSDLSGTWYIEFTKTSIEGPTILSLSVYHLCTSLTEYKMIGVRIPLIPNGTILWDYTIDEFHSLYQKESNKEPLNIKTFENLGANEMSKLRFGVGMIQFKGLLSSGQSADVWFKVGSEEISAHKNIICARVTYFKKMFESGMKEAVDNKVEVPDTDPEIFKRLLKFIYTGRVDEDLNDYAADLLGLAHLYDIQDLKGLCEASLLNLVGGDNLISTLITAHIYECPDLKRKCIDELIQGRKALKKEQLDQMKASLKKFPELCTEVHESRMMSLHKEYIKNARILNKRKRSLTE